MLTEQADSIREHPPPESALSGSEKLTSAWTKARRITAANSVERDAECLAPVIVIVFRILSFRYGLR